jgi:uncharacterized membrane protein
MAVWWRGPAGAAWFRVWILAVAAVIVLVRLAFRLIFRGRGGLMAAGGPGCTAAAGGPVLDAVAVLKRRLASGDLSEAEYLRLREIVER